MVSLDGTLINKGGTITGGISRGTEAKAAGFDRAALDALRQQRQQCVETLDAAVEALHWLLVVFAVSRREVLAETLEPSLLQKNYIGVRFRYQRDHVVWPHWITA